MNDDGSSIMGDQEPTQEEDQLHDSRSKTHNASGSQLQLTDNESEDQDYQPVLRKSGRGKATMEQQKVCSLPSTNNPTNAYKPGLFSNASIKSSLRSLVSKTKFKETGSGGVPQSSSLHLT